MWLNLHGFEAVRRKLKNSLKTQKMHFCFVPMKISQSFLGNKDGCKFLSSQVTKCLTQTKHYAPESVC